MQIVRRFAALVLIVVSLLVPVGAGPAMAATDHAGQADCPHAAVLSPAGTASHLAAPPHAMALVSSQAPLHQPAGPAGLPSCCTAIPTATALLEMTPDLATDFPGGLFRPISDFMPAQRSIGPDLPPPRA